MTASELTYQERMSLTRSLEGKHFIRLAPSFDRSGVPTGLSPTCGCGWQRLDLSLDEGTARDVAVDHLIKVAELHKVP